MQILIVDDDEINLDILEANLHSQELGVIRASDGAQAVELARLHGPDLIITDILMPNMDGYQLCRTLKADEDLSRIPVVFYSATYTDEEDQAFALELGAVRFMIKPEEPERFQRVISEVLAEHSQSGLPHTEPAAMEEPDYLHRYNRRLIAKLEDKLTQLDSTNRRLLEEMRRKEEAEAKIRYLAFFDVLTGLPNRVGLLDHAERALAETARNGLSGAVVIVDIDHFREINHTLGHSNGNDLLKQVAIRMQDALGEGHPYLARLGGDKFALVLHQVKGREDIERSLRALVECFERPFELEQLGVQVTASFGVSLFPEHGEEAVILLRHAEVAMDPSEGSRGAISFYSPDADPFEPKRLSLISDLRRGIDRGQLVLHYQPKIDLVARRTIGVEALVRWRHPEFGLLGPDRFVRLAEQTGQIRPMTSWLLEEGIRELAGWRELEIELDLCLNLTVRDLLDEDLPFEVGALLSQKGLHEARLTFEMTESAILRDPGRARRSLERLAGMGVKLAIDDFGTGYSSLSHLRFLPVKELKIDKSFVINMLNDGNDAAIVRSTIDFGHNLGLTVTAEGIEQPEILELLTEMGCDQAQGFLIGRPMPSDALLAWLDQTGYALGQ